MSFFSPQSYFSEDYRPGKQRWQKTAKNAMPAKSDKKPPAKDRRLNASYSAWH